MKGMNSVDFSPAEKMSASLTPEMEARADALVTELEEAGFSVVLALVAPDEAKAPSWVTGHAGHLVSLLTQIRSVLTAATCTCEKCSKKREQVRA